MRVPRSVSTAAALVAAAALVLSAVALSACRPGSAGLVAYVANAGNNHVQVLDLESGETLRRIYAGAAPWRLVREPGGRRLWVQHWLAETTAVVDLGDGGIETVLPGRGPGAFSADGERFLTFNWPGTAVASFDARTFEPLGERVTGVGKVLSLAPGPEDRRLFLVQSDPFAQGTGERFAYVVEVPLTEAGEAQEEGPRVPRSFATGADPVQVVAPDGGPFLLTADRGTDGLSVLNQLGDVRATVACAGPRAIVLSPDENRMAVLCWEREETRSSRVAVYRTDFAVRPWPEIALEAEVSLPAGLVAGRFSPRGERLYAVDRPGGRLLELDARDLALLRELPVGDEPMDLEVVPVSRPVRKRLAGGEPPARRLVREVLARAGEEAAAKAAGPAPITWTETVFGRLPRSAAETEAGSREELPARILRYVLAPPDRLRTEAEDGSVRLSAGGWALSVEPGGRFWLGPRQDLLAVVLSLPALEPAAALRLLAGDTPGSPYLRGGLAVDLATEVEEGGERFLLVGASEPGRPVPQLWLDAATGRPTNLVEKVPIAEPQGHLPPGFAGLVETKLYDFAPVAGAFPMPRRVVRSAGPGAPQEAFLEEVEAAPDLPPETLDLLRLGGTPPLLGPGSVEPAAAEAVPGEPGLAVPIMAGGYLPHPRAPHPPYNSDPPTSGPRLRKLAAWGAHRRPVPLELQVHNLEHGGVLIQYRCPEACPELVARLEELVAGQELLLLAPYPRLEHRIALTAWGRIDAFDELDEDRIRRFIDAYRGRDHHRESS